MTDPTDVPFPHRVGLGAWLLMAAGALVALCGLQLLAFAQLPNAIAWAPGLLIAVGLAAVPTGAGCHRAEPGAVMRGIGLAGAGLLISGGMSVYLLLQTVVSPLFWVAPVMCLGAVVLLVYALGAVRRYGAAQAEIQRQIQAHIESGQAGGFSPFTSGPPPASGWAQAVGGLAAAAAAAVIATAVMAPHALWRAGLQAELLAGGTFPARASGFLTGAAPGSGGDVAPDCPYPWSPLERYAAYEAKFVDFDAAAIGAFADRIAEEVGWQMMAKTGAGDVQTAEVALWLAGEQRRVPLWIAEALRARGVFYQPESLLSRSFDPWRHTGEAEIHLDCDQLTHLFSHVALRLDLGVHEVPSPMHMYLLYQPPAGLPSRESAAPLWIEATSFRRVDVQGNHVDWMGAGIGEDFFIDADYHPSGKGGSYASRAITEAAGFYRPADARYLEDSITANVMAGLEQNDIAAPTRQELEARLDGTRHYLLVSNLYRLILRAAEDAMARKEYDRALADAQAAGALHARFPVLIIHREPVERVREAQILKAQGRTAGMAAPLDAVLAWYAENAYTTVPPRATSPDHAQALLLRAELQIAAGDMRTVEDCDATFGAILRYEGRGQRGLPTREEICALLSTASTCEKLLAPGTCPPQ